MVRWAKKKKSAKAKRQALIGSKKNNPRELKACFTPLRKSDV
ncbi:hypothetical protein DB42_AY00050 [Neochlamydia sp. EPS4]|nr:hypothetical protein DB42_AY00050 [Neochlamydia sp. EPS4]